MVGRNGFFTTVVICISLLVLGITMFNNLHITKSGRQAEVDAAIAHFCKASGYNNNNCFDSAYAKNDTISYYKSNVFIGKTVIVTE